MENNNQLTKDQAIKIANSEIWKDLSDDQIVKLQLFQDRLCLPFEEFHKAIENVLNRSVFTHEFARRDELIKEYLYEREPPSLDEIINLIPSEKLIILDIDNDKSKNI